VRSHLDQDARCDQLRRINEVIDPGSPEWVCTVCANELLTYVGRCCRAERAGAQFRSRAANVDQIREGYINAGFDCQS